MILVNLQSWIHFDKNYKRFLDSIWKIKPQNSKLYSFLPSPIIPYLRLSVTVLRISIASPNSITVHSSKRANAFSVVASLHPKKKLKINVCSHRQTCLRRAWPLLLLALLFRGMVTYLAVSQIMAERLWSKVELRQVHAFTAISTVGCCLW